MFDCNIAVKFITVNRDGYFPIPFGNINIIRNGTPPLFCVSPGYEEQMLQEKHCHEFSMKLLDISTVGIIYSTCMLYIANHGNVSLQKLLPRVPCKVVVC